MNSDYHCNICGELTENECFFCNESSCDNCFNKTKKIYYHCNDCDLSYCKIDTPSGEDHCSRYYENSFTKCEACGNSRF